ncbi:hypothetical protein [Gordonia terrae]|uniref:hypothetical protein n=1 Tax=Gordonia terrae TaxID=2055 RepID=UPI003F6C748E
MLAAVVFVPSAPLLVPEVAGPGAHDTYPVRRATLEAVTGVAAGVDRWIMVGTADDATPGLIAEPARGTFARFGVDVAVTVGEPVTIDGPTSGAGRRMSLSVLIAGWIAGCASLGPLTVCSVGAATAPADCLAIGADLGAALINSAERIGVLVVGDGSTALTDKAPGGGRRESAVALNSSIVAALASADTTALAELDPRDCESEGVGGRPAWQVAAGIVGDRLVRPFLTFAEAPFGVGYLVATWAVGDGSAGGGAR